MDLFHSWDLGLDGMPKQVAEKKRSGFKKAEEEPESGREVFDPRKTRVPSYPTIADALSKGDYGLIFTTPKSKDIYVITHGTWGQKSKDKVVKSFPAGTPYSEIKGFSERTKSKHGGKSHKKGDEGREESGFATKDKKDKAKNFKPVD